MCDPYADGNGRVGRALIHTVLTRRGLTPSAILPISLVLLTRSEEYVAALTDYRYTAVASSPEANIAQERWIELFFDATSTAVEQAAQFAAELADMRSQWHERLAASRQAAGKRAKPRSDSAVARLIDRMPEMPLATTRTVEGVLDVSFPQARDALESLADAGVLKRRQVERGTTGYLAMEVFDLLTLRERQLASTKWDTRDSPPTRDVPDLPTSKR